MEGGSDGEINKSINQNLLLDSSKRPKRQMKTPFQLEVLEKTYAMEMYPSEATRLELSERLNLTDRQLQMWFCHRRLKDKKEAAGMAVMKLKNPSSAGGRGWTESPREEKMGIQPDGGHMSGSGSGSGSSQFGNGDETPMVPKRYYESPETMVMERRVVACVEAQLGEPLREDGPILGMEFDELPPGAFGAPIAPREQQDRYRHSYESKFYGDYDAKHVKASSSGRHEASEFKIRPGAYKHVTAGYLYESPIDGPSGKSIAQKHGNGHLPREFGVKGQVSSADILTQPARQVLFSPSMRGTDLNIHNEDVLNINRKRKSDEARIGKEVQAHEKRIRKELEKQDLLRKKREEQMKKEMERQDRERRKEEQRMIREQQRLEEKFQRVEKREMERREKFMQKELIRAERRKQKEELRKEKEAIRQKAAMERATARKMAKESMELIEDEQLELMELAASSKGLPSMVSLDYETLQNLDVFRDGLCEFPPKSVALKMPFSIQPWISSDENVGNLFMVWKFCITFADILGLWPFTLDEFIQAFHDCDSRLLGEIHICIMKLIIKDIEDVVRTPSSGPGTNQYSAVNPEGGHPHIVEGAYLWGFDIRAWQKHLNSATWPEILRQFTLSAGFGPQLKKKGIDRVSANENDESKGCVDIISTLRNGSAAENAVAIMQEKGFSIQRRSKHRLTPGTVKFAAYHVLALEGSKGLNVIELADKIQKSGLRDLTTSKTPEASISVALSRDPILFERIAPSTYNVRPAYRKDPADAETVIVEAKEKIQKYGNSILTGQNADEDERDNDDSDSELADGADMNPLATPITNKNDEITEIGSSCTNIKEKTLDDCTKQNGIRSADVGLGNPEQWLEIDENSRSGEPWVQVLTEGEYSDLSIEERLSALVALIGVANEGNSIRVILEERLDAVNALKKQMWAEAQLDKRRMREEIVAKYYDSSYNALAEGNLSPMVVAENKTYEPSSTNLEKVESSVVVEDHNNSNENPRQETPIGQFTSPAQQQNAYTAERSRMQLKSYIGHRAEEMYVYRSLPLGQDRRRNRYWLFVASASASGLDPGSGRIFVESVNGRWRLIDTEEAFDALLASLDTRGSRESHLHIMLLKIEVSFKECIRRNKMSSNISKENTNTGTKDAFEISKSDTQELSFSFRFDLGRDKTETNSLFRRYQDLQFWIWKECLSSLTLRALAYGKKRCLPLFGICDTCFGTYDAKEDVCPSCHLIQHKIGDLEDTNNIYDPNAYPLRIRLLKALLTLLEVSVPSEAIDSCWTEDCRSTWGLKLQNSSSVDNLLQLLTQFERAVKRDYLSSEFETTEELLSYCGSSPSKGGPSCGSSFGGSVPQLPWMPKTSAAVVLRLLELDGSIAYTPEQKAEAHDEKKVEVLPKLNLKYAYTKDVHKVEPMEFDRYGAVKEEKWDQDIPGSSGYRQVVRGRGGRPRGKSTKVCRGGISQSSWRIAKTGDTLADILMKQGVRGQKHGRGRRTVRRRRIENKVPEDTLNDYLNDQNTPLHEVVKMPTSSIPVNMVNLNFKNADETSESDSDDNNGAENPYEYQKWGDINYNYASARSNEMAEMSEEEEVDEIEDEVGYDDEDRENLDGNLGINEYDLDRDGHGNRGEGVEMDDDESDGYGDGNREDGYGDGNREGGFEEIDSEEEDGDFSD